MGRDTISNGEKGGITAMNESAKLRKDYRNIWCILRSLDRHEINCPSLDWPAFRDDPHAFFVRCDTPTADAIWKAVEKRMDGAG